MVCLRREGENIDALSLAIMVMIGLVAGVLVGLIGASGVMIVVSLLTLFVNFPVHKSIGTSLMANAIVSATVSFMYFRHNNLDPKTAVFLAMGSIIGAQVGALSSAKLPEVGLGSLFGIILIFMGIVMWRRGISREDIIRGFKKILGSRKISKYISLPMGFIIGIIAGMVGATGGIWFLVISYLVIGLPLRKAIGTSALAMVFTAISGATGHAIHGNISVIGGILVGLGASISGTFSARFANVSSERILVKAISIIFIALGIAMILTRILTP